MLKEANYAVDKKQRIHRIASLSIFLVWVILGYRAGGLAGVMRVSLFFSLPMACIWFPDAMSEYRGIVLGKGRYIDKPSNPIFLRWGGWFLLLFVPCLLFLMFYTHG